MFDHNTLYVLILLILADPLQAAQAKTSSSGKEKGEAQSEKIQAEGAATEANDRGSEKTSAVQEASQDAAPLKGPITSAIPQSTADFEGLPKYNGGDEFPVSRFGAAPSSAALEIRSHTYSAMEQYQGGAGANREIAGLRSESDIRSGNAPDQKNESAASVSSSELWRRPVQKVSKTERVAVGEGIDTLTESSSTGNISPPAWSQFERVVDAEEANSRGDELGSLNSTVQAAQGVQEVSVIATEMGFFPRTFFVNQEVPVRVFVTGSSKKPLCMMIDAFEIRKQVKAMSVQEIFFTPKYPGKYRVYCPINGLEGTMVVREPARGAVQYLQGSNAPQQRPRNLVRVPDQQTPMAHEMDREISSRKFVPEEDSAE